VRSFETTTIAFLDERIYPFIPERGSLGASGNLAPLSHMALPLMAEARSSLGETVHLERGAAVLRKLGSSAMTGKTSVTLGDAYKDNPLVFQDDEASFHGGNLCGQCVAFDGDYSAIALTEIGVSAKRHVNRLAEPAVNGRLPDLLTLSDSGLSGGLMGAQYLAISAAHERPGLADPSSSEENLPSNRQSQNIVSMGLNAAWLCKRSSNNVATVIGIWGLSCLQTAEIFSPERLSGQGRKWFDAISQFRDFYLSSVGAGQAARLVGMEGP
jgi:histidine ammonia-lyase